MLDRLKSLLPRLHWVGLILLALACLWIALDAWSCTAKHRVQAAESQLAQTSQTAATAAAQGTAYDQIATDEGPRLKAANDEVARLKAKLARLQQRPPVVVPDPGPVGAGAGDQPGPDAGGNPGGDDHAAAVIAAQTELIQAQDAQITELKGALGTMTLSRDSWRTSAQASAQALVQAQAVIAAKEGLARAEYWRGFRAGFLVGGGTGAAAGTYLGMRIK